LFELELLDATTKATQGVLVLHAHLLGQRDTVVLESMRGRMV
jgi:hypothetical protein